jgi:nicotinamide phosphoribosyltransferase
MNTLKPNLILTTDSYKLSHPFSYSPKMEAQYSYGEPRTRNGRKIVVAGIKMALVKYFTNPVTMDDVDEAEKFARLHGEPFKRSAWEKVVNVYGGKLPVTIRAISEGAVVPSSMPIYSIECTDPDLAWLPSQLETLFQRAVWYPTTIASNDYYIKGVIRNFYEKTGVPVEAADFALHDFGGRGVTCGEQAEIGGCAHLFNFKGSDTIEGVRAANYYYNCEMAGFSVPATEHSVQCSFSLDDDTGSGDLEYLRHQLKVLSTPGGIVSIVIDGYDVYRAAAYLCNELKQDVIDCGAKVVFRPDSGDMFEVVPRLLEMQAAAFGYTVNQRGYKVINNVGIIQGDGVNSEAIEKMLKIITDMGYAANSVVFGSGGALLQKVDRDTYKFAQKASAIMVDGEWIGISKNPVTDPGKMSKKGRVTTLRSFMTGEFMVGDLSNSDSRDSEWVDMLEVVYQNGEISQFVLDETLDKIRNRIGV